MKDTTIKKSSESGTKYLSDEDLRRGLREYIKKNKAIPDFYAAIDTALVNNHDPDNIHKQCIEALLLAIKDNNPTAPIFSHKDCMLYTLYLIEKDRIPFWQGLFVYIYLTTLAQFTDTQDLKPEDLPAGQYHSSIKGIRPISFPSLVVENADGKALTKEGHDYLTKAHSELQKITDNKLDYKELENYFLNELSPFEQRIIQISTLTREQAYRLPNISTPYTLSIEGLFDPVAKNLPFCPKMKLGNIPCIRIPSFKLINYILSKMSKKTMQMKPIFGKVSSATLEKLHAKNQHPIALYCPAVKSNLLKAHVFHGGPIPVMLHDIGHTYWGNMLSSQERKVLFHDLLPMLKDINHKQLSEKIVHSAVDLDLAKDIYHSPEERFFKYIQFALKTESYGIHKQSLAGTNEAKLLYMKVLTHVATSNDLTINHFWQLLIKYLKKITPRQSSKRALNQHGLFNVTPSVTKSAIDLELRSYFSSKHS